MGVFGILKIWMGYQKDKADNPEAQRILGKKIVFLTLVIAIITSIAFPLMNYFKQKPPTPATKEDLEVLERNLINSSSKFAGTGDTRVLFVGSSVYSFDKSNNVIDANLNELKNELKKNNTTIEEIISKNNRLEELIVELSVTDDAFAYAKEMYYVGDLLRVEHVFYYALEDIIESEIENYRMAELKATVLALLKDIQFNDRQAKEYYDLADRIKLEYNESQQSLYSNEAMRMGPSENYDEIKIASFQLIDYSAAKIQLSMYYELTSKALSFFDIIYLRGLKGGSQDDIYEIVNGFASIGKKMDVVANPIVENETSIVRNAILYNSDTIKLIDLFPANKTVEYPFVNKPIISLFASRDGCFQFVLIALSIDQKNGSFELLTLAQVIKDVKMKYPGEEDLIVLGNLNYNCQTNSDDLNSLLPGYSYYTPGNTYKRGYVINCIRSGFLIPFSSRNDYAASVELYNIQEELSLISKQARLISDNYPVWTSFYVNNDNDAMSLDKQLTTYNEAISSEILPAPPVPISRPPVPGSPADPDFPDLPPIKVEFGRPISTSSALKKDGYPDPLKNLPIPKANLSKHEKPKDQK